MSHDKSHASPYRKVSVGTWSDKKVRRLSRIEPSGQALFLMLMVGPQTTNIPGVQPVGRLGFAEMLDWSLEDFDKAFAEVIDEGLAKANWNARLVFVPKAIAHNMPQSPNVVKSWSSMWSRVPDCDLRTEAWNTIFNALKGLSDGFADAFKAACPLGSDGFEGEAAPSTKTSRKPSDMTTGMPAAKTTDNQEAVNSKQEDTPTPYGVGRQQVKPADSIPDCPQQEIINLYAKHLPDLPQPRAWEGQRSTNLRARWRWAFSTKNPETGDRYASTRDAGIAFFGKFFAYVSRSDFLTGRTGKWTNCNLAWLVKAENFTKVLEGQYENRGGEA